MGLEPWYFAAGALIARQAGAVVTKLDGRAEMLTPPYCVLAANPELYELMSAVIRGE